MTRFQIDTPVNAPDRAEPGALVSPTGRTTTNTGGHLLFDELARIAGLDPTNFAVEYGVSADRKQIPDLRVKVRRQCDLVLTKDKQGADCLVLALGTGLDKPVIRRKSAGA